MMNSSDPLIKDIVKRLDRQDVDTQTLARLDQARISALVQQPPGLFTLNPYLKPALAIVSVTAIAIALSLSTQPGQQPAGMDLFESMDIITSNDELEMYENLEFYLWLDEQIKT